MKENKFAFATVLLLAAGLLSTARAGTAWTYYKAIDGSFGGPDETVVSPTATMLPTQSTGKQFTAAAGDGQKVSWWFYTASPVAGYGTQEKKVGEGTPFVLNEPNDTNRYLVAEFSYIQYDLSYFTNSINFWSQNGKSYNQPLTVKSPQAGHHFDPANWTVYVNGVATGVTVQPGASLADAGGLGLAGYHTDVTVELRVDAELPNTYSIAYDLQSGAWPKTAKEADHPASVKYGQEFNVCDPERYGYTFAGWTLDGLSKSNPMKNLTDQHGVTVTLVANWQPVTSTVDFYSQKEKRDTALFTYDVTPNAVEPLTDASSAYAFSGYWTKESGGDQLWNAQGAWNAERSPTWDFTNETMKVYAHWVYYISFEGNGADRPDAMREQSFDRDADQNLPVNRFRKSGYVFAGWTNSYDTTVYPDEVAVRNLFDKSGKLHNTLYAKWEPVTYYLGLNANGGKPKAAAIEPVAYDNEQSKTFAELFPTAFTGYEKHLSKLVGWSNTWNNVVYAKDDQVIEAYGRAGTNNLVAVWADDRTDYSKAMHCDNLQWNFTHADEKSTWSAITDPEAGFKGSGSCVRSEGQDVKNNLIAEIPRKGTAEFVWKAAEAGAKLLIWDASANKMIDELEVQQADVWQLASFSLDGKKNVSLINEDGVTIDIDQMTFTPAETYTLHFDGNGGGGAPADIAVAVGDWASLPSEKPALYGSVFMGWTTNETDKTKVDFAPGGYFEDKKAASGDVYNFYAVWHEGTNVPELERQLVYTGEEQEIPLSPSGYVLTGETKATAAGVYFATATLEPGKIWSDLTEEPKEIEWTIAKGSYDMSGVTFADTTVEWTGEPQNLEIEGTLPAGVSVTYEGNGNVELGSYPVTAHFTGDAENYELIPDKTATLTIERARIAVPTAAPGLVYTGATQVGVAPGVGYSVVGNEAADAGSYEATVTPDAQHVWTDGTDSPVTVPWAIAKATYDMSGITFPSAKVRYDGRPHSIAIAGALPAGVSVVYSGDATTRTEVGESRVTASFVVADLANHNAIGLTLTATLTIVQGPAAEGLLYFGEDIQPFAATAAGTYCGWLRDPSTGAVLAALQVKTTAAKAGKPAKSTISVTPVGGKKKTYKASVTAGGTPVDEYGIVYGALALSGRVHGFAGIPAGAVVTAAKDVTKAKDPAEKSRAALIPEGCRTLALVTKDGGCDSLSITISKKGKASVKGTLADGTSVSLSVQGAVGDDAFAVPVVYSKKATFAFVLWIAHDDGRTWISDIGGDRWAGAVVGAGELAPPRDGAHVVNVAPPTWASYLAAVDGLPVTPAGETVTVAGKKWTVAKTVGGVALDKATQAVYVKVAEGKAAANLSKLKLAYTQKNGLVKGSCKLYRLDGGKLKADTAKISGVVVGGRLYGSVAVKKGGATPIWWE